MESLLIPSRFRGPDRSGNGGWSAGALAARLTPGAAPHPPVQVTLRMPPPLEKPLTVRRDGARADLLDGDAVVADAHLLDASETPAAVTPVPVAAARAASDAFDGMEQHPFPHCFVCGTARDHGDGLRLFPGAVPADGTAARVATTWTPVSSMAAPDAPDAADLPIVWAALDCPGAWTVDLTNRAVVLGRIIAQVDALPRIGEEHVVMGALLGNEGRKWFTAATLHDSQGRVVARAAHTWIEVDPDRFNA